MREMKIWDLPVRVFHWALVVLIGICWASAEFDRFDIHYYAGYAIFTLILFRLVWGVIGSDTAQLSACLHGPKALLQYIRTLPKREAELHLGHNPLGGVSVLAMLLVIGVQVGLGLFAQDIDFINAGPLADLISFDAGTRAAELHEIIFHAIQVLVVIHVLAIVYYAIRKRVNLVKPMFTGWKEVGEGGPMTPPTLAPTKKALIIAVLCVAVVWSIVAFVPTLFG